MVVLADVTFFREAAKHRPLRAFGRVGAVVRLTPAFISRVYVCGGGSSSVGVRL